MKHLRHLFTTLLLLCCSIANAQDFEVGGIAYKVLSYEDNTVEVARSSYSGSITIPAQVTNNNVTYTVSSIGNLAFYNCSGLTSIEIPNSVSTIADQAFEYCTNLQSITIPSSVTSLGYRAFENCSTLQTVNLSDGLISIGVCAFQYCVKLQSIVIPSSVMTVSNYAFRDCIMLEKVTFYSKTVPSAGDAVFNGISSSAVLRYPAGSDYSSWSSYFASTEEFATTIGGSCGTDVNWTYADGVLTISGSGAMNDFTSDNLQPWKEYCESITTVLIQDGVTSIGNSAFCNCINLTSLTIGNDVKTIGELAFCNTKLTNVVIPDCVTTIGSMAFQTCSELYSATIGSGVTYIGANAFRGCYEIETLVIDKNNSTYDSRENCNAIVETTTSTLLFGSKNTIIPDGIITIGANAFICCATLTDVVIPSSVTSIGDGVFMGCAGLTSVTSYATTAPELGENAFSEISSSAVLRYPAGSDYSGWSSYFASTEVFGAVTGITLSASEAELKAGETFTLTATIAPEDAFVKSVTWSSSNEAVAIVDENGVVTAVAAGDAIITATANDGSGVSATCNVTVAEEQSGDDVTYDNTIYASDIEAKTGTQVLLPICMDNVNEITALQFDLYLPEGITVVKDEDDYHVMELSERATARHTFESADMTDGAIRVICYSTRNTVFTGNAGEVMYVTVNVAEELADGEYEVLIKEIELTTPEEVAYNVPVTTSKITVFSYTKGDINDDGKISVTDITGLVNLILSGADYTENRAADVNEDRKLSVTDITGLVNLILNPATESTSSATAAQRVSARAAASTNSIQIAPFAISAGEEKEIYVLMDNPGDAFCGFQFNLSLPEGIELLQDELGYFVELGSRTTSRKHAIENAEQKDGSILVLCYSGKNMTFSGESGDVAVLTVKAADDLQAGVYNIGVNNIELSRPDETNAAPADYTGSVVAGDGGATELVLNGYFTADAMSEISGALAAKSDIVSVDITSAVYVDSEGSLTTGNSNTLVLLPSGESIANESNVVVDGFCQNLHLTDKMPFNAPVEFTAVNASYSRSFAAPTTATFVLPVAVPTAAVNGKVYKLSGYEGDLIKFSRVTEESLEANVPYVVVVEAAGELLNSALTNAEVVATPEDISVECGEIKHVGAYRTQEVVSGAETYYGYSGGMFVKANNGTLYPFRTMIAANGDAAFSNSYRTDFGEGTTGIDSVGAEEDDAIYFDLQGRRVKKTENGVFIINGKKTFIK